MQCTHTKNYHTKDCHTFFPIQKIYYVVHTQKNCHTKKCQCFFYTHKKILCNPRKKITSIFYHTKKLLCSAPIQKITIQKIAIHFFPYKKFTMQCTHKKIAIHFLLCIFFHTKNYYVLHAKKITYKKNVSVFPIQKNYYVVHTQKNHIQKNYHTKNLLCILTHKKLPYKKMLVFFLYTQKNIM